MLEAASAEGVPVLPVHDSFIVTAECAFWIKDKIEEVYKKLMGFDPVIDWE